jgi:hypothetical protein
MRSSTESFRELKTLGVEVCTTIPFSAGMAQDATSERAFSTSTTHTLHAPTGFICS